MNRFDFAHFLITILPFIVFSTGFILAFKAWGKSKAVSCFAALLWLAAIVLFIPKFYFPAYNEITNSEKLATNAMLEYIVTNMDAYPDVKMELREILIKHPNPSYNDLVLLNESLVKKNSQKDEAKFKAIEEANISLAREKTGIKPVAK